MGRYFATLEGQTIEQQTEVFNHMGLSEKRSANVLLRDDLAAEINVVPVEYAKGKVGWLRFSGSGDIKADDVVAEMVELTVVDAFGEPHKAVPSMSLNFTKTDAS